jgi:hypothetical protein
MTLAVALAACGDGSSSGQGASQAVSELSALGLGNHLGKQAVSRSEEHGQWKDLFYDPALEQAICLYGGEYQVSVHRGTTKDVLIYLEGGGACWNYETCYLTKLAKQTANTAVPTGALDIDNPQSPFRDWNIVYVPYCDGSVFAGDNTVDYNGNRTFHHGRWNLSVGVDAIASEIGVPDRIVVAGSSAGGYGTFTGYSVTRVAFPDTPIIVFNDSGPGLQNSDATQDLNDRLTNWKFGDVVPPSCTECSRQFSFLIPWSLERDAGLRVALYSFQQDAVIRSFIHYSATQYQSLLLDVTGEIESGDPQRFKRFFPRGDSHTILERDLFYEQQIGSESIRDWTQAFLDDGDAWRDLVE